MAGPPLTLVSYDLCPYVERSRIVLLDKDVPHRLELIDLAHKPDWLLRISPMGRVPVLLVGDRPVFESMIINELLDELHPHPPLLPGDPLTRAETRSWIVFANDVVMPAGHAAMLALAGPQAAAAPDDRLAPLRDAFGKLEAQVARGGGPYFAGTGFTLADAAYAPFFRRWRDAEGWGVPGSALLHRFPALSAWAGALAERPSVRGAEPAGFAGRHRAFLAERAARARGAGQR